MPSPWEPPKPSPRGDSKPTPIYTAVGMALSSWERVEHDLADMFAIFTGSVRGLVNDDPAIRAYGTIISYKQRIQVLEAAAKAYFARNKRSGLERSFKILLKKCNGWSDRRNDIAHGIVLRLPDYNYRLWPALYNSKKYPLNTNGPVFIYRASQIRSFNTAFRRLGRQSSKFVSKLSAFSQGKLLAEQALQFAQQNSHPFQGQTGPQ